jgi:uncharacterized tellurite resistance protein B-like protein
MLRRNDMVTTVTHRIPPSPSTSASAATATPTLLIGPEASPASPARVLDDEERRKLLCFAASFAWADGEVAELERRFVEDLAARLGVANPPQAVAGLLAQPPAPGEVDPASVRPALASLIRRIALDVIAADGRVDRAEMTMFELLDDLLPPDVKDI